MTSTPTTVTTTQLLHTWEFRRVGAEAWQTVRLPHDAMIHEPRRADAPGGADVGYFVGGAYEYRTSVRPAAGQETLAHFLRFEGVQGDAQVTVNGTAVGRIRSGYVEFELPLGDLLLATEDNEVVVHVDHVAQPASRWYPGSGLYRPVHLVARPATHFAPDGVRLRTTSLTPRKAEVTVGFAVEGRVDGVRVDVRLLDGGVLVAQADAPATTGSLRLDLIDPRAWSDETPHLYRLVSRLIKDSETIDERSELVGLRQIAVDARRGLQINGRTVLLRGACIHHDNGILGAATHRAAEFRRVRLLKEAGFNAIRSAHNPMSRHLLDACDTYGMYVLDELADYWFVSKTAHDHAHRFRATWQEDADRLVEKDRNHPCVVMYAIGNEIPETATPAGVTMAQEMTAYMHAADPDRPVTVAVNLFLNTMVSLNQSPYKKSEQKGTGETSMAGSTEANVMVNQIGKLMNVVSRLPRADKASRDVFGVVDVAGYNYGIARYKHDARVYPERVILGSETLPGDVARAWRSVQDIPAVIGDFVWTGFEYLGESGVAVWVPGKRAGLSKPYPYIVSGPGLIDLTGRPDTALRLAQAAWGHLTAPAIAVRPVDRSGEPTVRSAWRSTDAVESWSWRGCEGRRAEIEVYATEDQVELFLNGRSLGRRRTGEKRGFKARFTAPYEPGELVAVGYRAGREVSRSTLRSAADDVALRLTAESPTLAADGTDLTFVWVEVADAQGVVEMLADDRVDIDVDGPAELIGFGTAAPATDESFDTPHQRTFRGRALAILRSTGSSGDVRVTARSQLGEAELMLTAVDQDRAAAPTNGAVVSEAVTAR